MAYRTKEGWRVNKRVDGQRVTMRFPTEALATQFERELDAARILSRMPLAKLGLRPESPPGDSMTFAEYAETWHADYCKLHKAESQHREDRSTLDLHLIPALGPKRLDSLRRRDLLDLQKALSKTKVQRGDRCLSPKTVNNITGLAAKILATAADEEIIVANPFARVKPLPIVEQHFDYWTPKERDHFLRFARQHDAEFTRVVQLACFSGLRHGEITALRRRDIDFDRNLIILARGYSFKLRKDFDRTKGGRADSIALHPSAREALLPAILLKPSERIFPLQLLDHAWERLQRLCKKTESRVIRFHDLRHTFASCLAMDGVDRYTIQKLMRHATANMTERYMHLSPEFLHRELGRLKAPGAAMAPVSGIGQDKPEISAG